MHVNLLAWQKSHVQFLDVRLTYFDNAAEDWNLPRTLLNQTKLDGMFYLRGTPGASIVSQVWFWEQILKNQMLYFGIIKALLV